MQPAAVSFFLTCNPLDNHSSHSDSTPLTMQLTAVAVQQVHKAGGQRKHVGVTCTSCVAILATVLRSAEVVFLGGWLPVWLHRQSSATKPTHDPTHHMQGDKTLYLSSLKSMLSEMRSCRPADTPFGHTQQLQPQFPKGTKVAKAQRLALNRARPPLAAAPSVWARRQEPISSLDHATWPHSAHATAAAAERAFWAQCALRPVMQPGGAKGAAAAASGAAPVRGLSAPAELGHVTAAAMSSKFLAVGTAFGAVLVWSVLEDRSCEPLFQVCAVIGGSRMWVHDEAGGGT